MKYVILLLTICTLIAVSVALIKNNQAFTFTQVFPKGAIEITFLIAFLGWMPAPLDISIWQSIWSLEKERTSLKKQQLNKPFSILMLAILEPFF